MQKRYSEMTSMELETEIARLQKEGERSLTQGMINELYTYEQKYYLAKSYLIGSVALPKGFITTVAGEEGSFIVDRVEGVMVWGKFRDRSEERAFPLAMLHSLDQNHAKSK